MPGDESNVFKKLEDQILQCLLLCFDTISIDAKINILPLFTEFWVYYIFLTTTPVREDSGVGHQELKEGTFPPFMYVWPL